MELDAVNLLIPESTAPEAVDLSKESEATKTLYGLDDAKTKDRPTSRLVCILGDPDPKGPIFFLYLN